MGIECVYCTQGLTARRLFVVAEGAGGGGELILGFLTIFLSPKLRSFGPGGSEDRGDEGRAP